MPSGNSWLPRQLPAFAITIDTMREPIRLGELCSETQSKYCREVARGQDMGGGRQSLGCGLLSVCLRTLGQRLPTSTRSFPSFHRHTLAIADLPATKRAIAQEGITFEGAGFGAGLGDRGATASASGTATLSAWVLARENAAIHRACRTMSLNWSMTLRALQKSLECNSPRIRDSPPLLSSYQCGGPPALSGSTAIAFARV